MIPVSYVTASLLVILGCCIGVAAMWLLQQSDEKHAAASGHIWLQDELYVLTPFGENDVAEVRCSCCGILCNEGDLLRWLDGQCVCPECLDELNEELFGKGHDE